MGAGKEHTHQIVNGVRPMLPASPDLLQIFYYQPEKFYKLTTHTPIPNTLTTFFSLLFSRSLSVFLFWDDFPLHLTLSIYRRSLESRWT